MRKILFLVLFLLTISNSFSSEKVYPMYAYQSNNEWSVVDNNGNKLFSSKQIIEVCGYSDGLIRTRLRVRGESVWAYLNIKGEVQFKIDTDGATEFQEGKAIVYNILDKENLINKYGMINKDGSFFKPIIYNDALGFTEGLAYIMNDSIRGYIDSLGNLKLPLPDKIVGFSFREGYAAITNEKLLTAYIDKTGKEIIPFKYNEADYFNNGYVKVSTQGKFGFVDKTGEYVIPMLFGEAKPVYDGVTLIAKYDNNFKNVAWAVLTVGLKMLTDWRYTDARAFEQGLAAVKYADKWGFINTKAEFAFQENFNLAESFAYDGLAYVKKGNTMGFIDKSGKMILELPKAEKYIDLRWNKEIK